MHLGYGIRKLKKNLLWAWACDYQALWSKLPIDFCQLWQPQIEPNWFLKDPFTWNFFQFKRRLIHSKEQKRNVLHYWHPEKKSKSIKISKILDLKTYSWEYSTKTDLSEKLFGFIFSHFSSLSPPSEVTGELFSLPNLSSMPS